MSVMASQGRLLFVHAHPDDETIGTGIAMSHYADAGHQVTLVTCTLGEEGEVLVPELEHLASMHDDTLGPHREGELADAMAILGVTDHRLLGGAGRYRDSGMMGTEQNERADAFWQADLTAASAELAAVIRQTRPHVLVTYDEFGGYGHPDHIQAHRVAMYGSVLAAAPSFKPELGAAWDVPKIYWTAFPQSSVDRTREVFVAKGIDFFSSDEPDNGTPWACPDEWITTQVRDLALEPRKVQALLAHRTQITKEAPFLAISEMVGPEGLGTEHFRLVRGQIGPDEDADGRENDLLSGLSLA
jgi:N-acetyl-1-D-myo-inositol-2-amino-2-deoxy-alpha-D-glucopyranoside deacetylase